MVELIKAVARLHAATFERRLNVLTVRIEHHHLRRTLNEIELTNGGGFAAARGAHVTNVLRIVGVILVHWIRELHCPPPAVSRALSSLELV